MAKVTLMPGFVQELHGSLGKNSNLIFRTTNGKVSVYKKSERPVKKKATPVQVDQRERFKQATESVRKTKPPTEKQLAVRRAFAEKQRLKRNRNAMGRERVRSGIVVVS